MIRGLLLFAVIVLGLAAPRLTAQDVDTAVQTAQQVPVLRIGVRSAARPFSYKTVRVPPNMSTGSGPIVSAGYDGYMVHICDEVIKQMMIRRAGVPVLEARHIQVVDVDVRATERRKMLKGAPFDRTDLLEDEVDILCDPASISSERTKRFAVSPPVFITGVGYLKLKGARPPGRACRKNGALIGFVGSTNAARSGVLTILNSGEWKNFRTDIIAALREPENDLINCPPPNGVDGDGGIFWIGDTHDDVAEEFCKGNIAYYVGDLEIIAEHTSRQPGCQWSSGARSFTTDRYAIYANIDYQYPEKALLIGRFLEVLNREIAASASLLDRAFIATFGEAQRSQKLDLFFWSMRGSR